MAIFALPEIQGTFRLYRTFCAGSQLRLYRMFPLPHPVAAVLRYGAGCNCAATCKNAVVPENLPGSAPLIVTAELPAPLQSWAEGLRRTHFPAERNFLRAHVTLFHALPARVFDEVRDVLSRLASTHSPVTARLTSVMDLGGGTAFRIESEGMLALREEIADHFHGMLTVQDGHTPRLHVTVQNKVVRATAMALQADLRPNFRPCDFAFAGLALHHYLGGPWGDGGRWSFRGANRA